MWGGTHVGGTREAVSTDRFPPGLPVAEAATPIPSYAAPPVGEKAVQTDHALNTVRHRGTLLNANSTPPGKYGIIKIFCFQ
jgi:hypothetical protein